MYAVRSGIYLVVWIYLMVVLVRLVFDWIRMFSRSWRPSGLALVVAEGVYTATDPPLNALRKLIPPLRIGAVSLDLAFLVLVLGLNVLLMIL